MKNEDKPVIQETIDRLLYFGEEYKAALEKLNKKYDPHKKATFSNDPREFKFGIEHAI